MPTWINHFRVTDKLIYTLNNIDIEYFVIGTIAPDCGKYSKSHGMYRPYTGITHFTKDLEYSKKTDCNYNYVYETYVKNETDIKKRSFYLAYYIHLFEDCIFANDVFLPIEKKYGDFRYNDNVRNQVAKERNNIDFMFISNNESSSYNIFKNCKPFREKYPKWYKHGEIASQMKNIVKFYTNSKYEEMNYKYISPQTMDNFVEKTISLVRYDLDRKNIL